MCLVLFALDAHPHQRLVVLANRDEAYARPTAASAWWSDAPDVFAGRDLQSGGTWMGVTRTGRWAAVTNVRDPASLRAGAASRGDLTRAFLTSSAPAADYAVRVFAERDAYNGFNLLVGDGRETHLVSSRRPSPERLEPGVYGLSNDTLDTPWPKVTRGKASLSSLLDEGHVDVEAALGVLSDAEPAPDAELPETGVGVEWERILSPPFVRTEHYGTRTSTVLTISRSGRVHWTEQHHPGGPRTTVAFEGA